MQKPNQVQIGHKPKSTSITSSEQVVWDDVISSLGHRNRGGRKTWIVQTRIEGKTRKRTLGSAAYITLSLARELATNILTELNATPSAGEIDPSLESFANRFLEECAGQWKPSTQKHNRYAIEKKILPSFGSKILSKITRSDVVAWHRNYEGAPTSANRNLAVLSSLFRHAELVGLRPPGSNPAQGLRQRQSGFKATYLDGAGWQSLGTALRQIETTKPMHAAFIRFLCLTGCRRGEAQGLTWSMINGSCAILPDSKSGQRSIWLGKPAQRLLSKLSQNAEHVFATPKGPLTRNQIDRFWTTLRKSAGLGQLRLHDLRHSFASLAINNGIELRSIGGLLGHSDINSTEGYAHLDKSAEQDASQRVVRKLENLMAKPTMKNRNRFERFIRSNQPMAVFCEQWGFDKTKFHRELLAWRKTAKGAKR